MDIHATTSNAVPAFERLSAADVFLYRDTLLLQSHAGPPHTASRAWLFSWRNR